MDKLNKYFQDKQYTQHALDRYLAFSKSAEWYIGGEFGKLPLYNQANCAFASESTSEITATAFYEMYNTVRKWPGVQRGGSLAPAQEILTVLQNNNYSFLNGTVTNLANIKYPSDDAAQIRSFLPTLKFIKPTKDYP